jgi:hypothetical protein
MFNFALFLQYSRFVLTGKLNSAQLELQVGPQFAEQVFAAFSWSSG